jgi:hypothetical protein
MKVLQNILWFQAEEPRLPGSRPGQFKVGMDVLPC